MALGNTLPLRSGGALDPTDEQSAPLPPALPGIVVGQHVKAWNPKKQYAGDEDRLFLAGSLFQKGCVRGPLTMVALERGARACQMQLPAQTHLGQHRANTLATSESLCHMLRPSLRFPPGSPKPHLALFLDNLSTCLPWASSPQTPEKSAFCSSRLMTPVCTRHSECFADTSRCGSPSPLECILSQWSRQESRG